MNCELQVYNEQNKLAQRVQKVAQCRDSGLSVLQWYQNHGVNMEKVHSSVLREKGNAHAGVPFSYY